MCGRTGAQGFCGHAPLALLGVPLPGEPIAAPAPAVLAVPAAGAHLWDQVFTGAHAEECRHWYPVSLQPGERASGPTAEA